MSSFLILKLFIFINVNYFSYCNAGVTCTGKHQSTSSGKNSNISTGKYQLPINTDETYQVYLRRPPVRENEIKLTLQNYYDCKYNLDYIKLPTRNEHDFASHRQRLIDYCNKEHKSFYEVQTEYGEYFFETTLINDLRLCIGKLTNHSVPDLNAFNIDGNTKISLQDLVIQCIQRHFKSVEIKSYQENRLQDSLTSEEIFLNREKALEMLNIETHVNTCIRYGMKEFQTKPFYECTKKYQINTLRFKQNVWPSETLLKPKIILHWASFDIFDILNALLIKGTQSETFQKDIRKAFHTYYVVEIDKFNEVRKCRENVNENMDVNNFRQLQFLYNALPMLNGTQTYKEFCSITKTTIAFMKSLDRYNPETYKLLEENILPESTFLDLHDVEPVEGENYSTYLLRAKLLETWFPLTDYLWISLFEKSRPKKNFLKLPFKKTML